MKNDENLKPNSIKTNGDVLKHDDISRKKGIRKGALITAIIGLFILVTGGVIVNTRYTNELEKQHFLMENQKLSFIDQLVYRDSVINEWVLTFNQIENDLTKIKQKENLITISSPEGEFSKEKKQQILDDLKYINSLLDQNKMKISGLNAQLKKSGGSIKGLRDKIVNLETSLKETDNEISNLKLALADKDFEVKQLNTRMTDMQFKIAVQEEQIGKQREEMNKAFLVSGTYKELKKKGLVLKEGGFLGLGKRESLIEDFDNNSFTQINVNQTKTIPVNSKNVKLITEHPRTSYNIVREKDKIASIEIMDPDQFWKISKYAVVEFIK